MPNAAVGALAGGIFTAEAGQSASEDALAAQSAAAGDAAAAQVYASDLQAALAQQATGISGERYRELSIIFVSIGRNSCPINWYTGLLGMSISKWQKTWSISCLLTLSPSMRSSHLSATLISIIQRLTAFVSFLRK